MKEIKITPETRAILFALAAAAGEALTKVLHRLIEEGFPE